MKDWAKKFYNSKTWRTCRKNYLATQYGLCERCHNPADVVHHKIYLTPGNINNPHTTLDPANLEALCQDCHNREHHQQPIADLGYTWNAAGEIVYAPQSQAAGGCPNTESPV